MRSFSIPSSAHNFIFSPEGDVLWLFAGSLGVFKISPDSGEIGGNFKTNSPVRGLTYTRDKKHIIVSAEGEIYLMNPDDMSVHKHFKDLDTQKELEPVIYLIIETETGIQLRLDFY